MMFNKMSTLWITVLMLVLTPMHNQLCVADIGVCLGLNGNNLPPATDIINLYHKYNIKFMRLFEPIPEIIGALSDVSDISLILGVRNEDIPKLASSIQAAADYIANLRGMLTGRGIYVPAITIGNEIVPGELAQYIAQAIINVKSALDAVGKTGIRVTTVVSLDVLGTSFPPSAGAFTDAARPYMVDILRVLSQQRANIFINVYPYFAYASNPSQISLDYVLFNAQGPVLQDGPYSYSNLFDAMVDSFISAMEREGITNVGAEIGESGWPSAGNGEFSTPDIAGTYNRNLARHLFSVGTPKRPSAGNGGFLFAMFEENLKPEGVEQHFGLFFPNTEPVYPLPMFTKSPAHAVITNSNYSTHELVSSFDNNITLLEGFY